MNYSCSSQYWPKGAVKRVSWLFLILFASVAFAGKTNHHLVTAPAQLQKTGVTVTITQNTPKPPSSRMEHRKINGVAYSCVGDIIKYKATIAPKKELAVLRFKTHIQALPASELALLAISKIPPSLFYERVFDKLPLEDGKWILKRTDDAETPVGKNENIEEDDYWVYFTVKDQGDFDGRIMTFSFSGKLIGTIALLRQKSPLNNSKPIQ